MMPNQQGSAAPKGNAQGWEEGERPGVEGRVVALTMQFDDMPTEIPAAAKGCSCWSVMLSCVLCCLEHRCSQMQNVHKCWT